MSKLGSASQETAICRRNAILAPHTSQQPPSGIACSRRAAARALGVDERTIRRWTKLPGFAAELEKARERHERELERAKERERKRRERNAWRRFARLNPEQWAEARTPRGDPSFVPSRSLLPIPGPSGESCCARSSSSRPSGLTVPSRSLWPTPPVGA